MRMNYNVNLTLRRGQVTALVGQTGSGKSTLIRHINRLIEPSTGEIIVDDDNVLEMSETELREFRRFKASMVFQRFALLPHRTITNNVA